MQTILEQTTTLLQVLGHNEGAYGISYADEKPAGAFSPSKGVPISRELEDKNEINFKDVFADFCCFYGNIWLARKKQKAATISQEEYGCFGGAYYTGYLKPYLLTNAKYVSTGVPGVNPQGERYLPSVESTHAFMQEVDTRPAPKKYCVFKPLAQYSRQDLPEFITFFARGEALSGLCSLAWYTTGDVDVVRMPFGAGCTNLVGWPLYYAARGEDKVVLGGADLSCRKFAKTDEFSFTVSFGLYEKMLTALPESALYRGTWEGVRKKVLRSQNAWKENQS